MINFYFFFYVELSYKFNLTTFLKYYLLQHLFLNSNFTKTGRLDFVYSSCFNIDLIHFLKMKIDCLLYSLAHFCHFIRIFFQYFIYLRDPI